MKKIIHTIKGRNIYIDTHPKDLNLIAIAIANQIDIEECKIGDDISIPLFRYGEEVSIRVEVKEIIKKEL